MRIFGLEITRQKDLRPITERGGWHNIIRESYPGAWQENVTVDFNSVLAYHPVFACQTLIARDIAKLRIKLLREQNGVWLESTSPAFSPILRKPNHYQTRAQFVEQWVLSKLMRGNTYVLKARDNRMVVTALYVLDPQLVKPLVTDSGDVYYELHRDDLSRQTVEALIVPASEIIHDRWNALFHPLVGVSPIFAAALGATQGLNIQKGSNWFFGNKSIPGGVLTAPGHISDDTAARLKESWETKFSGESSGKIAVLGDDLKFEAMTISAADSQLIEQLKYTAETVCSTFHVPPYKIGIGDMPSHNNIQALNLEYYSQALQSLIEDIEACLDDGLALPSDIGVELDIDGLLRMDTKTQMQVLELGKSMMTLDERRSKLSLPGITGGDTVYLQQQDHSIEAIAARDKLLIDHAENPPALPPAPQPALPAPDAEMERDALAYRIRRRLEERLNAP